MAPRPALDEPSNISPALREKNTRDVASALIGDPLKREGGRTGARTELCEERQDPETQNQKAESSSSSTRGTPSNGVRHPEYERLHFQIKTASSDPGSGSLREYMVHDRFRYKPGPWLDTYSYELTVKMIVSKRIRMRTVLLPTPHAPHWADGPMARGARGDIPGNTCSLGQAQGSTSTSTLTHVWGAHGAPTLCRQRAADGRRSLR